MSHISLLEKLAPILSNEKVKAIYTKSLIGLTKSTLGERAYLLFQDILSNKDLMIDRPVEKLILDHMANFYTKQILDTGLYHTWVSKESGKIYKTLNEIFNQIESDFISSADTEKSIGIERKLYIEKRVLQEIYKKDYLIKGDGNSVEKGVKQTLNIYDFSKYFFNLHFGISSPNNSLSHKPEDNILKSNSGQKLFYDVRQLLQTQYSAGGLYEFDNAYVEGITRYSLGGELFEHMYNNHFDGKDYNIYIKNTTGTTTTIPFSLKNVSFYIGLCKLAEKKKIKKITPDSFQSLLTEYTRSISQFIDTGREELKHKDKTKIIVLRAEKDEDHGAYLLSSQKELVINHFKSQYGEDNVIDGASLTTPATKNDRNKYSNSLISQLIEQTKDQGKHHYKIIFGFHGNYLPPQTSKANLLGYFLYDGKKDYLMTKENMEYFYQKAANKNISIDIMSCFSGYLEDGKKNKKINNINSSASFQSSIVGDIDAYLQAFDKDKQGALQGDYDKDGIVNENEARVYQMLNYNYSILPTRFQGKKGKIIEIADISDYTTSTIG